MYIKENKSIEDICTSLGVSRASFYYYKNRDKTQNQIDWDELKLINAYIAPYWCKPAMLHNGACD